MQRLPLIALLLAGCATTPKPGPWSVATAPDAVTAAQALAIVDAAKTLYPGTLEYGKVIRLLPDIDVPCWGAPAQPGGLVTAACFREADLFVKWPHPKCPAGADLTCSAEAHELCHLALRGEATELQADACGLLVAQEWRRSQP